MLQSRKPPTATMLASRRLAMHDKFQELGNMQMTADQTKTIEAKDSTHCRHTSRGRGRLGEAGVLSATAAS